VNELKKSDIVVSERTIARVFKNNKVGAQCKATNEPGLKKRRSLHVYTSVIVKEVRSFITSYHLLTQRHMAHHVRVSKTSIHRLIDGRSDYHKTKKVKVYHLADRAILQHKGRTVPFSVLISEGRYNRVFTIELSHAPIETLKR
jgi:hypothetical protein